MAKPHLVLIGNAMAGARLLEEILSSDIDAATFTPGANTPHSNVLNSGATQ